MFFASQLANRTLGKGEAVCDRNVHLCWNNVVGHLSIQSDESIIYLTMGRTAPWSCRKVPFLYFQTVFELFISDQNAQELWCRETVVTNMMLCLILPVTDWAWIRELLTYHICPENPTFKLFSTLGILQLSLTVQRLQVHMQNPVSVDWLVRKGLTSAEMSPYKYVVDIPAHRRPVSITK